MPQPPLTPSCFSPPATWAERWGRAPCRGGRQNAIFELGFFLAKLGHGHVAALLELGVEQPSDIAGLAYIAVDAPGAWKLSLARELTAAGIAVAYERIP